MKYALLHYGDRVLDLLTGLKVKVEHKSSEEVNEIVVRFQNGHITHRRCEQLAAVKEAAPLCPERDSTSPHS
ncbi:MAG TPA: hypothetical protein DCQ64_12565 [Candidatus Rokubacteria bacterium]|nr:hypothetical protein [Candidatus Rokubacteria bacterium]